MEAILDDLAMQVVTFDLIQEGQRRMCGRNVYERQWGFERSRLKEMKI